MGIFLSRFYGRLWRIAAGFPGAALKKLENVRKDRSALFLAGLFLLILEFFVSLPDPLFSSYYSPVLYDRTGKLLGAMASFDGQWRFPAGLRRGAFPGGGLNEKFAEALIEAEDRRFLRHSGIDFFSLGRAFIQNIRAGKVVSGGSTLTMQTIRLSRPRSRRSLFEKALEAVLAMRLELSFSKKEILSLYAANAPFGANVVGLEAASWRWFARGSADLSWAEAAVLAVLPNGPGLIHPGRNRALLRSRRDALLERLYAKGLFDGETLSLAKAEELPGEPLPLPNLAPHLLSRIVTESGGLEEFNSWNRDHPLYENGFLLVTTLDAEIQDRIRTILDRWALRFSERGISSAACVLLDTGSGETLAYIGNVTSSGAPAVDIVLSPRSSGSLLKPFLYAAMLDSGDILPASLVSDIPTRVGSYSPENNSRSYLGIIRADAALARSLNVPAVRSLRLYGVDRFAALLRGLGLTTLFRKGEDYGLPLILGGAEVNLWEITGLYAGLGRAAFPNGKDAVFFPPRFFPAASNNGPKRPGVLDRPGATGGMDAAPQNGPKHPGVLDRSGTAISPGAAWLTLEALTFVTRPGEEAYWQEYAGSRNIAWKTGTSFGNRDAWAVGITPGLTLGVWIGNASGEGRAELGSAMTSAPVLFEIFSALHSTGSKEAESWFLRPDAELTPFEVCAWSGFPSGPDCGPLTMAFVPKNAPPSKSCPYCRTVALNESETARIVPGGGTSEKIVLKKWFVLPPAEEWYYRRWNLDYKPLPPPDGVHSSGGVTAIALFNPEENGAVYVPKEIDGREGRIVFQAADRERGEKIYWHLDDAYLGMTEVFHELEVRPAPGRHVLTLVDSRGNTLRRNFEVLGSAD